MENFELIQQLKLELIQAYEPYVRTVAGLTSTPLEDAREAFHTAICKMLVGLRKRPPGNPIVAWRPYIIQAAVNQLREQSRQVARREHNVILFSELDEEGRQQVMNIPDPHPNPLEQAEKKELEALAWEELQKLRPCERDVITKRCHGQAFGEIAGSLSVEPETARAYWARGLATLRSRLRRAA